MTLNYGIKVSKPGVPVLEATPDQLIFSSKYPTLRVHQRGSGAITHTAGRTVTIAHNLGYVPYYVAHANIFGGSNYYQLPHVDGSNVGQVICWADSTNLYIKLNDSFGWQYFYTGGEQNNYGNEDSGGYSSGWCEVGRHDGNEKGALRFNSVTLTPNSYLVKLMFNIAYSYGTGDIFQKIYGIEEANTANFSSSPFGRKHTDGVISKQTGTGPGQGDTEEWDVTSLANEVMGTAGWSSGNYMGFFLEEDHSDSGRAIYDEYINTSGGLSRTYLKALQSDSLIDYKYTIFKDRIE